MSHGLIAAYRETVTAYRNMGVLEPGATFSAWSNYASQQSVRSIDIAPDSGELWLGTWGGVLAWKRKDGVQSAYRRYGSEHGLAGNAVRQVCVGSTGRPWVSTLEGALCYFDGSGWQVYEHLHQEPIRVLARAVGRDGIWAASGIMVYYIPGCDAAPIPSADVEDDAAKHAEALLDDGDGVLLGNAWGLFRITLGRPGEGILPGRINECTALALDADGRVWIGVREAVYRLYNETLEGPFAPGAGDPAGRVVSLAVGRTRVWVLTTGGLAYVHNDTWVSVPIAAQVADTLSIAPGTDDGFAWVGTERLLAGVSCARPEDPLWFPELLPAHEKDELSNLGRCATPLAPGEGILAGTVDGLVRFGPQDSWKIESRCGDVRALAAASRQHTRGEGVVSVLAWPHGVGRYRLGGAVDFRIAQPPSLPLTIAVGRDAVTYVITGRALWRLEDAGPVELSGPPPALPRCLLQTPDGKWWLGTNSGVFRLSAGEWTLMGDQPGPLRAEVYALTAVGESLWAGTEAGLWAWQSPETAPVTLPVTRRGTVKPVPLHPLGTVRQWRRHAESAGEASARVTALGTAGEAGCLWLAKDEGVCRYDPLLGKLDAPFTPLNSGLASRRVTALVQTENTLWIVTEAGISRLVLSESREGL
jgi:hypothetical protein